MGKIIRKNWKTRLFICSAVLMLSLLFIGAGKVTRELTGRKDSKRSENRKWEVILTEMGKELPVEYRSEWNKIVEEQPEVLMNTVAIIKN